MDNKMTTHKVQGIIKDDRREEQKDFINPVTGTQHDNRTTPHNYFVGERDRRKPLKDSHIYHARRYTPCKRKAPYDYYSPPKPKLIDD